MRGLEVSVLYCCVGHFFDLLLAVVLLIVACPRSSSRAAVSACSGACA
jgi:hypothetical protein